MRSRVMSAILVLSSCSSPVTDYACLDSAEPGVLVFVQDSLTGAVLVWDAEVILTDGAYSERLRIVDPGPALRGAEERPGTYSVTVGHPGYLQWSTTGISVVSGVCHVITVKVTARLVPIEPPPN